VSLALFLTEIGQAVGRPGIILDDPVCSMDEQWKGRIAVRLAKEARERQVIVFTHSIAFFQELAASCDRMGCPILVHTVQRIGGTSGYITDEHEWGGMNLKRRLAWLRNCIQEAEAIYKRDPASVDYRARFNLMIDRMRATWERVVEEGMFSDAVLRYRKAVETRRIGRSGLASSAEVFAKVHWGMTEMSGITEAHDTPAELGAPIPGPVELKRWLGDLEEVTALINKEKEVSKAAMQAAIQAPLP